MDDEILVFCNFPEYSLEKDVHWNERVTEKRMFYGRICFIDADLKSLKDWMGFKTWNVKGLEEELANNVCYES